MTTLLDTHSFLWFVTGNEKLPISVRRLIESRANAILLSPASYWEIAIKISRGKYELNTTFEAFWQTGMRDNGIDMLPIEIQHAARLTAMPFHHADPFDRLLVAQALAENIPLVSDDPQLDAYGVERIW